jgi:hypothetical protein
MGIGIGRSIAYQYKLPQQLPQDVEAGSPIRGGLGGGGAQSQMLGLGGDIPVPEGLQWVDNQTSDIYQKWGSLTQFAKLMKTQYGMDVTNPDYTDPNQVQISQAYQKGVADLYMKIDKFKNSQRMLEEHMKRGQGFVADYDPSEQPYGEVVGTVEDYGLLPETEEVLQDYQILISDVNTAAQANILLSQHRDAIEERLESETNPARRVQIQRSLDAIQGALYDPTEDKNRFQRAAKLKQDLADRDAQIRDYAYLVGQVQQGQTKLLGTHRDTKSGKYIFDDISELDPNGNVTYRTIDFVVEDPSSPSGFRAVYGEQQKMNVFSEAGKRIIAEQLNKFGKYDQLLYAYAKGHPSMGKETVTTVDSTPEGEPVRPEDVGRTTLDAVRGRAGESQEIIRGAGEVSEALTSGNYYPDDEIFSDLISQMSEKAKQRELTVPKGMPMRDKSVNFRVLDPENISSFSQGGEEIVEIDDGERWWGNKGGISLLDKDGNKYFIPVTEKSREGFGKYDEVINEFFKINKLNLGSKSKAEKQGKGAKQEGEYSYNPDTERLMKTPDGRVIVTDKSGTKFIRHATKQ